MVGATAYAADFKVANMGASYDFGPVKLMGFVQTDRIAGQATIDAFKFTTYAIGATAPIGVGMVRGQSSHYKLDNSANGANKLSLGHVHNLSVRTALYAEVARINNKGAARCQLEGISGVSIGAPAAGQSSTGYGVGLKHTFWRGRSAPRPHGTADSPAVRSALRGHVRPGPDRSPQAPPARASRWKRCAYRHDQSVVG